MAGSILRAFRRLQHRLHFVDRVPEASKRDHVAAQVAYCDPANSNNAVGNAFLYERFQRDASNPTSDTVRGRPVKEDDRSSFGSGGWNGAEVIDGIGGRPGGVGHVVSFGIGCGIQADGSYRCKDFDTGREWTVPGRAL